MSIHVASSCDLGRMEMIRIKNIIPKKLVNPVTDVYIPLMFQKFVLFLYRIPQLKLQQNQLNLSELSMTGIPVKNPKLPKKHANPLKISKAFGTGIMDLFSFNVSFRIKFLPSQSGIALLGLDKQTGI